MIVLYFVASLLASTVSAGNSADLEGTWTTKSRAVVTGPVGYRRLRAVFGYGTDEVFASRDSMTQSTTNSSSQTLRVSRFRSQRTGTMRKHSIGLLPIVSIYNPRLIGEN
jgi:hypothetical protein